MVANPMADFAKVGDKSLNPSAVILMAGTLCKPR
jgi:hypothetical protein